MADAAERHRQRQRAWRERNREQDLEAKRRYRESRRRELSEKQKARYAADPEQHRERARQRWAANAERMSETRVRSRLKSRYDVTPEEVAAMLVLQDGRCALCGEPPLNGRTFHIDHDHETGRVRGLLHSTCNQMLGLVKEDPNVLRAAISYLSRTSSRAASWG